LIEKSESVSYSVEKAIEDVEKIRISGDVCEIQAYIDQRKEKNDVFKIPLMLNENLSPSAYSLLLRSQVANVSVNTVF
jgi:hypothetical protein